jgi:fructose-bisphosphate aldolase, class II
MRKLIEVLRGAQTQGVAVGHFNLGDYTFLKSISAAARALNVPVIVGASEGEREFLGTREVAALVKSLRDETRFPIFLNADHTHSLTKAVEAAKAGFDSIVFDLSHLPFEENVRQTKEAIQTLKQINPDIVVEGEIGDIGTGSEIHDSIPDLSKGLTSAAEAKRFVDATGVDVLAPAVGNMHGVVKSMLQGETHKHLDIARISQIKKETGALMTLHGGSATADDDLRQAIAAGINIIHINTELRVAWRRGIEEGLAKHPNEVVPYKILPSAIDAVREVVLSRLKLFNTKRSAGASN